MAESEEEIIEYLDEDADIVQQCVQVQENKQERLEEAGEKVFPPTPLLVERPLLGRKRKKKDEEDSDYDPREDITPQSPAPSQKNKKKKTGVKKVFNHNLKEVTITRISNSNSKNAKKPYVIGPDKEIVNRKKKSVRIPDYDDPLCLPVKAIQQEATDTKRLNNWNNVCLEHFKHCDNLLKPERGETHSSTRTVVFRNVFNKQSAKKETTIWSKTCVQNEDGDKKSEIFQCVLPRYREKNILTNFGLITRKPRPFRTVSEVILSKEDNKDGETLVAYKPREAMAAVYKLVKEDDIKESKDELEEKEEDDIKMYMKETVCCKMCVPCFQTSWRGVKRSDKKPIACPICRRSSFVTAYNLLSHFKTHPTEEIRKYKTIISKRLSEIVDYHYKCRVCRENFNSIKKLRQHIVTHQGNLMFTCEVCHQKTR